MKKLGITIALSFLTLAAAPALANAANCLGVPATIEGTNGPNTLTGTVGDDVIVAKGGKDLINGLGGNDKICAGGGDDNAFGGTGDDDLLGEGGNDKADGGDGQDLVIGDWGRRGGTTALTRKVGRDRLYGGTEPAPGVDDRLVGDNYGDASVFNVRGGSRDVLRLGAGGGIAVGDSFKFSPGTATGGGNDKIIATNGGTLVGDSYSFANGSAFGGGDDEIEGTGASVFADSQGSLAATGGGDDEIAVTGGGNVYADAFSPVGNATGGGDDKVFASGGGAFWLDAFAPGPGKTATGGGDDLLINRNSGSVTAYGDAFSPNGPARFQKNAGGDDRIIDRATTSTIVYADTFSNASNSSRSGDDYISSASNLVAYADAFHPTGSSSTRNGNDVIRAPRGSLTAYADGYASVIGRPGDDVLEAKTNITAYADGYAVSGSGSGAGNDQINAATGTVFGDIFAVGKVLRGGGDDRITLSGPGSVYADCYSASSGAVCGGDDVIRTGPGTLFADGFGLSGANGDGQDRIFSKGGTIFGDPYAASGIASGASRDVIDLRKATVAATVFADTYGGSGTKDAARDLVYSPPGINGSLFYLDPYASSGSALASAADEFQGGSGNEVVFGDSVATADPNLSRGGGDDLINTRGGNDTIYADHQNPDSLFGGRDRIFAGGGADQLNGGARRDYCDGGRDSAVDTANRCEIKRNIP